MSSESSQNTVALGKSVLSLQEERVRQYAALAEAHKAYLASGPSYDLETFKGKVKESTTNFQDISRKIIDVKQAVESDKDLSNLVEKLQSLEESKLRFTVDYQLALQQSLEESEDELAAKNTQGLKKRLNELAEEVTDVIQDIRYHLHDLEEDETVDK